jgi:hypothetical protein
MVQPNTTASHSFLSTYNYNYGLRNFLIKNKIKIHRFDRFNDCKSANKNSTWSINMSYAVPKASDRVPHLIFSLDIIISIFMIHTLIFLI